MVANRASRKRVTENEPVTAKPSAEPTSTGAALAVRNAGRVARKYTHTRESLCSSALIWPILQYEIPLATFLFAPAVKKSAFCGGCAGAGTAVPVGVAKGAAMGIMPSSNSAPAAPGADGCTQAHPD
jgi:hypothetical protein